MSIPKEGGFIYQSLQDENVFIMCLEGRTDLTVGDSLTVEGSELMEANDTFTVVKKLEQRDQMFLVKKKKEVNNG